MEAEGPTSSPSDPLAGLTADRRVLSRFLSSEFINDATVYDAPLSVSRLALLADKAQVQLSRLPPCMRETPLLYCIW